MQDNDIDLKYLSQIDLDQISLSSQEQKPLEKFYLRKNFAMALTKKKEPLYWGTIVDNPKEQNKADLFESQFIDVISSSQQKIQQDSHENQDPSKKTLLCKRIQFFKNIKIAEICCNDFAVHFLSEDGMLYTMGKDTKKYGILGLGNQYEMTQPHPNTNLIDFRISKISMGLSHCCALTSGGQLYSWGTGQNGQLCLQDSDTMFSNVPKLVTKSKNMHITNIFCSNYYTLILNSQGHISLYGTLKGFAKFLFDSPTKDPNGSQNTSQFSAEKSFSKFKLMLEDNQIISKVSIAEKAFAVYCQESHNLYFINEDLEVKYNILLILSQSQRQDYGEASDDESAALQKWKIIKEFNLIQEFNSHDIELLPQDISISTKKAQSLQLLTFMTQNNNKIQQQPSNIHSVAKKYYKTFLTSNNNTAHTNQLNGGQLSLTIEDNVNEYSRHHGMNQSKKHCQSPFSSYNETGRTRNKLQLKLDSLFQSAFSAKKNNGNRSTSIKERAKKLHQSLSPIQRFPIINNLCELIKQHQLNNNRDINSKSPPKFGEQYVSQSHSQTPFNIINENKNDKLKSPQYNLLFQSLNLACQLSSLGTRASSDAQQPQSQKQLQFLSKADKIRQELSKKNQAQQQQQQQQLLSHQDSQKMLNQGSTVNIGAGAHDLIEIASPNASRNDQSQNAMNYPLQMPQNRSNFLNSHSNSRPQLQEQNLSCIFEDKENSTIVIQSQAKPNDQGIQNLKHKPRQQSLNLPQQRDQPQIINLKHKAEKREILNIDTISEISGCCDSINRFSGVNSINTNTNNYKILVMNARNVIEKKILQGLMLGFNAIKYHQAQNFQSFQLESINNSNNQSRQIQDQETKTQAAQKIFTVLQQNKQNQMIQTIARFQQFSKSIQEKKRSVKKLGLLIKQKQEQLMIESLRKIQLSIRFKKLQRLNINLLFNCFSKLLKRQQKQDLKWSIQNILEYTKVKRQFQAAELMDSITNTHLKRSSLHRFKDNKDYKKRYFKGLTLLRKTGTQIQFRKNLNSKSQALYNFKKNVISFNQQRTENLQNILFRIQLKKAFKSWLRILMKRKAAVQQALFLKMFIQDKLKQNMYNAIVKIINYSNLNTSNQTKKSFNSSQQQQTIDRTEDNVITDVKMSIISRKPELVERSIQNDYMEELDIEETQMEEDQAMNAKIFKSKDLPRQRKDFSFEKNECGYEQAQFHTSDNNLTAHFNKWNLMSRGKEQNSNLQTNSDFKENSRPHYHCHYANYDKDTPDAFILDPSSQSRISISNNPHSRKTSFISQNQPTPRDMDYKDHTEEKQNLTQTSKLKICLQNEISPTNNCKNYQRQAQLNKNYEQAEPFELPMNDIMDFNNRQFTYPSADYAQFIDKDLEQSNIADNGQIISEDDALLRHFQPRYSFKQVVPFNPPDDTPSTTQLRQKQSFKQNSGNKENLLMKPPTHHQPHQQSHTTHSNHQVFQSKKTSNASASVNSFNQSGKTPFINNYFMKLSAQNSAKQEQQIYNAFQFSF